MTADCIKINPLITLKFSVKAEMPLSQHPYLCLLHPTFVLARTARRLPIAYQQLNLPKRKILLCAFKLKLNNILQWH